MQLQGVHLPDIIISQSENNGHFKTEAIEHQSLYFR